MPAQISVGSARGRWIAALILLGVYILHSIDRFVVGVVIEPIRHEFGFTDTQLGAIGGLAHAIAYSACVLPIGWLLDRTNRVRLLAGMLAVWSLVTMLGALATGFWFLFLMRMGVGAAESASSPGTQSLLASIFPVKQRASAMGFVFSGTAIGTGLVFAIGGPVAQHFGWRAVFLLAGLPGVVLAFVMWRMLQEPSRNAEGEPTDAPVSMRRAVATFVRSPPILLSSFGSMIAAMSVASIWIWITPILIREQGFSLASAGVIVGVAAGVLKFASGFLSGFVGDWIAKGRLDRLWIVPSCALALSVPTGFGIAYAPTPFVAAALVMLLGLSMGTHYAAPKTVIMSAAPDNMRGSISALEQLMINLIGVAIGPLLTGLISDYLGGQSVSLALAATLSFNLAAALSFWLAGRSIARSTRREGLVRSEAVGTTPGIEAGA